MASNGIAVRDLRLRRGVHPDVSAGRPRLPGARRAAARHERPGLQDTCGRGDRDPDHLRQRARRRAHRGERDQGRGGGFHPEAVRLREAVAIVRARSSAMRGPGAARRRAQLAGRLAALTERERGRAAAHHRGQGEQGDRRRARHQRQDGRGAPRESDGEDGGRLPWRMCRWCRAPQDRVVPNGGARRWRLSIRGGSEKLWNELGRTRAYPAQPSSSRGEISDKKGRLDCSSLKSTGSTGSKNLVITAILLFIWFVVTFVEGWYARELNSITSSASRSASTCRRRAR